MVTYEHLKNLKKKKKPERECHQTTVKHENENETRLQMVRNYCLHSTVKTNLLKLCVMASTFNPSTWEGEAGQGQPGLQSESEDNQGNKVRPCLGKNTTKQNW